MSFAFLKKKKEKNISIESYENLNDAALSRKTAMKDNSYYMGTDELNCV
jgi:hypothetical protein